MTPKDLIALRRLEAENNKHVRHCKRSIEACPACQANIAWYASLPLDVLSELLNEPPKAK